MRFRALTAAVLATTVTLGLAACGGGSDAAKNPDAPLRVGASPVPHAQILNYVKDELAKDKGLKLEVVEITDYVTPNTSLAEKSLDANYFQHKPYLEKFEADKGVKLQWVGPVHLEPLAAFSRKGVKSLAELGDGAKVAVPNDPTNEARALTLLAQSGVLELKAGTERTATKNDVTKNPKNLQIVELEAAQVPRSLDEVDAAVINGNYALQAGQDLKSALAVEKAEGNPYANGLVTRPELANDERIKKLQELLTSPKVKEYIEKNFKGAVTSATS
ncbi:MetQ/NlpA family ABC transporter substrate-binding protein [Streptoalloteichus hindustanus]|uniref:Lipoprotein n=1 Tax=Streptoalloteichus hindustanus TaxID=2017 RepID=A0A1M5KVM9_STRHI|nr:MetQ/NlpA family ABC transporter substrate-binding protein [Streptoalloteichus hindustanus]SHG56864.1 D-methionine transport system substrate-binding protein [Streptoalloteichus hindustanus]